MYRSRVWIGALLAAGMALVLLPRSPAALSTDPAEPTPTTALAPCDPVLATEGRWIFLPDALGLRAHTLVHDTARDRLVVFGGTDRYHAAVSGTPGTELDKTWVRPADLSGPWRLLETAGPTPPRRVFHVAIYDPVGDRLIVHAGWAFPTRVKQDLWQLDFRVDPPRWSELVPAGSPPGERRGHAAVYDPVGRRMLIFGGYRDDLGWTNEFWELSLGDAPAWRRTFFGGGLLARRESVKGTYDSQRRRWILSGGEAGGTTVARNSFYRDVRALDLESAQGTALPDLPHGATSIYQHTMTYDAPRDRLLVFGGGADFAGGVYALSLTDPTAGWRRLADLSSAPESRLEHEAWFDARRNRYLVVGGARGGLPLQGTQVLSFGRVLTASLDPRSNRREVPHARRPRAIALYGTGELDVREIDPATIRVGGSPPLVRGAGSPAVEYADVDGDGRTDAAFEVDGHAFADAADQPAIEVRALTTMGEDACGTLATRPAARSVAIAAGSSHPAPWTTDDPPRLSPVDGGVTRARIELRLDTTAPGPFDVELWSVSGRRMAAQRVEGGGSRPVTLRPSPWLSPGVYWVRVAGLDATPLRLVVPR